MVPGVESIGFEQLVEHCLVHTFTHVDLGLPRDCAPCTVPELLEAAHPFHKHTDVPDQKFTEEYLRACCSTKEDGMGDPGYDWLSVCRPQVDGRTLWIPARGRTREEAEDAAVEAAIQHLIGGIPITVGFLTTQRAGRERPLEPLEEVKIYDPKRSR